MCSAATIHSMRSWSRGWDNSDLILRSARRARLEGWPHTEAGSQMLDGAFVYILRCADGSYYSGTAREGLEPRLAEHNSGAFGGYTSTRLPVVLVYSEWFQR